MKLPRRQSINERQVFQNVRQQGTSRPGRFLVLGTLEDPSAQPFGLGLITTKKLGNAVTRNQIRRYLRAVVQKHGHRIKPGRQIVVIGRWKAGNATFHEIESDFLKTARKLGVLEEER